MPYRAPGDVELPCPRCGLPLAARTVADTPVDACDRCGGLWVGGHALDELIGEPERRDAARAELPDGDVAIHPGGPLYVACPVCRALMARRQFALGAKVVVDRCAGHGTWFDGHELARVLAFVADGGLERAQAREEADRRDAERAARATPARRPFEPQTYPSKRWYGSFFGGLIGWRR